MISKSDYILFLKQPAWLWLKKNDPSKLPPVDANTQAMFDAGHAFEPFAESLFPEGVSLGFSDYSEYTTLPQRTLDAIESGAHVLFNQGLTGMTTHVSVDIVKFVDEGVVDLYEIKASTAARPTRVRLSIPSGSTRRVWLYGSQYLGHPRKQQICAKR